jgi:hypothetical protein
MVQYQMNDELKRIWKEVVRGEFEVLPLNLPAGNNKTTNNLDQESLCTSRDSNLALPEHYRYANPLGQREILSFRWLLNDVGSS